jgi:hypothetical protein
MRHRLHVVAFHEPVTDAALPLWIGCACGWAELVQAEHHRPAAWRLHAMMDTDLTQAQIRAAIAASDMVTELFKVDVQAAPAYRLEACEETT